MLHQFLYAVFVALAIVSAATADDEVEVVDTDGLHKVTPHTIHAQYAVEAVRTVPFTLSPDDAVARFREAAYKIVPAPDTHADHPQLFYAGAPYTIGVQEDGTIKTLHPTISVVVHKNGISLTYRSLHTAPSSNAAKYEFCNSWNYRYHASTCFVDKQGKYNLQNDVQFVTEKGLNGLLVDEGMQFFQRSLKLFAERIVETPYKERTKKASDL